MSISLRKRCFPILGMTWEFEMMDRNGDKIARVNLRKRWIEDSATSKPEPFPQKPQKRFGTLASFSRA